MIRQNSAVYPIIEFEKQTSATASPHKEVYWLHVECLSSPRNYIMYGDVLIDTHWQLTAGALRTILLYQFRDAENIHLYFIPIVSHCSLTVNDLPLSSRHWL